MTNNTTINVSKTTKIEFDRVYFQIKAQVKEKTGENINSDEFLMKLLSNVKIAGGTLICQITSW